MGFRLLQIGCTAGGLGSIAVRSSSRTLMACPEHTATQAPHPNECSLLTTVQELLPSMVLELIVEVVTLD